jgi:hypothetical protein
MKELKTSDDKPIIKTHYPLTNSRKPGKRWIIASTASQHKQKKMQNECVESAYMRVINAVKRLYLKPGTIYYEKDSRQDKSESATSMHSFITSNFYWHLHCSYLYEYEVEFAFNDCEFEAYIKAMLIPFPLDRQATERKLRPDFNTFFETVLQVQDKCYLHSL